MNRSISNVGDILKTGIEREIEAQHLYADLANRVTSQAARYAFSVLEKEEKHHQEILETYLKGGFPQGALDLRQTVDYRIAESSDQPQVSKDMGLPAAFLLAANREKASVAFYTGLAAIHPDGTVRQLLLKLASEESGHKQKIEAMYSEVAFPQTDGG
jgi:rubrerythrin